MLEVELVRTDDALLERAARAALAAAGVNDGHLAVELIDAARMRALNREHGGADRPTDVLAFPVDGTAAVAGPRELGDVLICPERTEDLAQAVVHGVLHLCGYDHAGGDDEMLALQERVLTALK